LGQKRLNYERAGVREYWVVENPYLVHTFVLGGDGNFAEQVYRNETAVKVQIFADLTIDFTPLQRGMFGG